MVCARCAHGAYTVCSLLLLDRCEGGIGIAARLHGRMAPLLRTALEMATACPCRDGCWCRAHAAPCNPVYEGPQPCVSMVQPCYSGCNLVCPGAVSTPPRAPSITPPPTSAPPWRSCNFCCVRTRSSRLRRRRLLPCGRCKGPSAALARAPAAPRHLPTIRCSADRSGGCGTLCRRRVSSIESRRLVARCCEAKKI